MKIVEKKDKIISNLETEFNFNYHLENAKEEFRSEIRDIKSDSGIKDYEPYDLIHDIADNNVPVMTSDLLRYAINHIDFAICQPEILAFDGNPTAINAIAGNMYELLCDILSDEWESIKENTDETK